MRQGEWILIGAVAGPVAITAAIFLLTKVVAPGSELDLWWAILPVLIVPVAVVGAIIGLVIALFRREKD